MIGLPHKELPWNFLWFTYTKRSMFRHFFTNLEKKKQNILKTILSCSITPNLNNVQWTVHCTRKTNKIVVHTSCNIVTIFKYRYPT